MSIINNENDFRNWFIEDFLRFDEDNPSIFEPEELEREIIRLMPYDFPCLVLLSPSEKDGMQILYRSQVEAWARLLNIIV